MRLRGHRASLARSEYENCSHSCSRGNSDSSRRPAGLCACVGPRLGRRGRERVRRHRLADRWVTDPGDVDPQQSERRSASVRARDTERARGRRGAARDPERPRLRRVHTAPRGSVAVEAPRRRDDRRRSRHPRTERQPSPLVRHSEARPIVAAIANGLSQVDPAGKVDIPAGVKRFLESCAAFRAEVRSIRPRFAGHPSRTPSRSPVTSRCRRVAQPRAELLHPRDRGRERADPGCGRSDDQLIDGKRIKALLYNSQTVSPITERIRAAAVAHQIPVVGVSETLPPHLDYQQWQLGQARALATALAPLKRAIVELDGLTQRAGPRELWRDLSLDVDRGEFLAVLGPNGAGKSDPPATDPRSGQADRGSCARRRRATALATKSDRLRAATAHVRPRPAAPRTRHGRPRPRRASLRAPPSTVPTGASSTRRSLRSGRTASPTARSGGFRAASSSGFGSRSSWSQQPDLILADEPLLSLDLAQQQNVIALLDGQRASCEHPGDLRHPRHQPAPPPRRPCPLPERRRLGCRPGRGGTDE